MPRPHSLLPDETGAGENAIVPPPSANVQPPAWYLRAHALLKLGFYRSKMKPFEAKYATTFPRFQRRVEKGAQENFAAWDDLIEWEAYYRSYQEWKKRYIELRQWSDT